MRNWVMVICWCSGDFTEVQDGYFVGTLAGRKDWMEGDWRLGGGACVSQGPGGKQVRHSFLFLLVCALVS